MCDHHESCGGCSCHLGHAPCTHCEYHSTFLSKEEVQIVVNFLNVFRRLKITNMRQHIFMSRDLVNCWGDISEK